MWGLGLDPSSTTESDLRSLQQVQVTRPEWSAGQAIAVPTWERRVLESSYTGKASEVRMGPFC